ncbi:unnamed protein product [Hymenolepis diminuta]|uniref:Transmembrane protein n=1 Tax=Hymenolepis diminuta TaxID=6216 RepID=A0A0R3SLC9_HYMDI|nr:unnamed protein product [Hymenolepis diminuta]
MISKYCRKQASYSKSSIDTQNLSSLIFTLKSYIHWNAPFSATQSAPSGDTPSTSTVAVRPTRATNAGVRLDLREIGKQLFNGVTYNVSHLLCSLSVLYVIISLSLRLGE